MMSLPIKTSRTSKLSLETKINSTTATTRTLHTIQRNNKSVSSLRKYLK